MISAMADSVTHWVAHVGRTTIPYTARAGSITLNNDRGQPTVRIFYTAFTADGTSALPRPVTFLYNGGPGSASIWLRMGSFRRCAYRLREPVRFRMLLSAWSKTASV